MLFRSGDLTSWDTSSVTTMTRKSRGDAWRTGLGCLSQPCLCIAYDHPEYRDVSQAVAASFFEVVKEPISYLFFSGAGSREPMLSQGWA